MNRVVTAPVIGENGYEAHPAWGMIGASRLQATPGVNLFDSDILHQNVVRIRLATAVRRRDLHHDYVHADQQVIEVEMSEAQWASFVSTMNVGDGVPCTIAWTATDGYIDGFPHAPALAETMAETHQAAEAAFAEIRAALADYENATTAKEKKERLGTLRARIQNATPNVDFAGKQLVKQAEDVVAKAKADVEAFVITKARQLGIDRADLGEPLAIDAGEAS